MNDDKDINANTKQQAGGKKPYVCPSFRCESLAFETVALACGKISQTQAQCHTNRKNS